MNMEGFPYLYAYFLPAVICLVGYSLRGFREVRSEIRSRDMGHTLYNRMTVGRLVGWLLISICPLVNIVMALFRFGFESIDSAVTTCQKLLDIPLVKERKKS